MGYLWDTTRIKVTRETEEQSDLRTRHGLPRPTNSLSPPLPPKRLLSPYPQPVTPLPPRAGAAFVGVFKSMPHSPRPAPAPPSPLPRPTPSPSVASANALASSASDLSAPSVAAPQVGGDALGMSVPSASPDAPLAETRPPTPVAASVERDGQGGEGSVEGGRERALRLADRFLSVFVHGRSPVRPLASVPAESARGAAGRSEEPKHGRSGIAMGEERDAGRDDREEEEGERLSGQKKDTEGDSNQGPRSPEAVSADRATRRGRRRAAFVGAFAAGRTFGGDRKGVGVREVREFHRHRRHGVVS